MYYSRNIVITIGTALFLCLFFSCAPPVYRYKATTVNTAMFHDKGDFQVVAGGSPEIGGFNTAYALTDHFGIGAAFNFSNASDSVVVQDTSGLSTRAMFFEDNQASYEIAAMYFNHFPGDRLDYEVQVGFAYDERTERTDGKADLAGTIYDYDERKRPIYTRYFIQPAFGKNGKYFDWNVGTRFQMINYLDLEVEYPDRDYKNYTDYTIEPVATVRAGYKFIKVMVQVGLRLPVAQGPYDYVPIHLGAGLVVPINKLTKGSKEG